MRETKLNHGTAYGARKRNRTGGAEMMRVARETRAVRFDLLYPVGGPSRLAIES